MSGDVSDVPFAHSLTLRIPFPTARLAKVAMGSLSVDRELSSLVKREFRMVNVVEDDNNIVEGANLEHYLEVLYYATTARMLRVAVNGFFDSLSVVVQVMEELDVDVLHEKGAEGLEGVQGIEHGMAGTIVGLG